MRADGTEQTTRPREGLRFSYRDSVLKHLSARVPPRS